MGEFWAISTTYYAYYKHNMCSLAARWYPPHAWLFFYGKKECIKNPQAPHFWIIGILFSQFIATFCPSTASCRGDPNLAYFPLLTYIFLYGQTYAWIRISYLPVLHPLWAYSMDSLPFVRKSSFLLLFPCFFFCKLHSLVIMSNSRLTLLDVY